MVVGEATIETEVAVIGGGPGGYAAAFRAADLGLEVTLIEQEERLGGVCLLRGCIPSKTLLYLTNLIYDAGRAGGMGVRFEPPSIDLQGVRAWKDGVIGRLVNGLTTLSQKRDVQRIQGRATFESARKLRVSGMETTHVKFEHAILATGSQPITLPNMAPAGGPAGFDMGSRVMSSAGALELADVPERLLVVGAGYVGMELGSVYATLGSRVTVVELAGRLLPGTDRDLVRPLERRVRETFEALHLDTRVAGLEEQEERVVVTLEGDVDPPEQVFDRVLVAIGRRPSSAGIGLEKTAVEVDGGGFVRVDAQRRTAEPRIFAVGDVVGGMMLAHKAMHKDRTRRIAVTM